MHKDAERILVSKKEITAKVKELGAQITRDYKGEEPLIVGILRGSFVFMSDLVRAIKLDCTVDFLAASSYGKSTTSSGHLKIIKDLDTNIEGKHVIVVEDILDSGITLSRIVDMLKVRKPASIKVCALLNKPDRRQIELDLDYCGFVIPNEFVIGYGLDYDEKYRNLPDICVLKPEVYTK